MRKKSFISALVSSMLLCACQSEPSSPQTADLRPWKIGVSQCSSGPWREKQNLEMEREILLHEGTTMIFHCADDDPARQVRDIEEMVAESIDLLIVSPESPELLTPAVSDVFRKGIPVVIFDRKISSDDFTAQVSGDNIGAGQQLANYAISKLPEGGKVIEITGLMSTTPAMLRHQGLIEGLQGHPEIELLATVDGRWDAGVAFHLTDSLLTLYPDADVVLAHSDWMARNAKIAGNKHRQRHPLWAAGIDGWGNEGEGLQAVEARQLDATAIYPTGGDVIVQTAFKILNQQPFERETVLESHLVSDPETASLVNSMQRAVEHEVATIRQLNIQQKEKNQEQEDDLPGQIAGLAMGVMATLILAGGGYVWAKRKKNQDPTAPVLAGSSPSEDIAQQPQTATAVELNAADSEFLDKLHRCIEQHLADEKYSVEMLASDVCLSRTQLFRKCKVLTNETPVELIRNTRLRRAQSLLQQGNSSVTEVAARVGFADASYFSKCYKGYFGVKPSEKW